MSETSETLPDANNPRPAPAAPEPWCALVVMCLECGQGTEVPLPVDQRTLSFLLAHNGWFISVLSPPEKGTEARMVIGPLCGACAQQVYPPEVFAAAEQKRQQLVQALAAQAGRAPQEAR